MDHIVNQPIVAVPGTEYPEHAHDVQEELEVFSGKLELNMVDAQTLILNPGDKVTIPAGRRHSARVLGESKLICLASFNLDVTTAKPAYAN